MTHRRVSRVTVHSRSQTRHAKRMKVDGNGIYKSDTTPLHKSKNELDTRADTICCGDNFRLLATTGQTCEVSGFHREMKGISDIEVATCATAWTCPKTGVTWILIINEGLYFGSQLDHSLINPNQIRSYGTPVWDNPFDSKRALGMDCDEVFIPFVTSGATVFFESHAPTDDELEHCPHIVLTSAREWYPHNILLGAE